MCVKIHGEALPYPKRIPLPSPLYGYPKVFQREGHTLSPLVNRMCQSHSSIAPVNPPPCQLNEGGGPYHMSTNQGESPLSIDIHSVCSGGGPYHMSSKQGESPLVNQHTQCMLRGVPLCQVLTYKKSPQHIVKDFGGGRERGGIVYILIINLSIDIHSVCKDLISTTAVFRQTFIMIDATISDSHIIVYGDLFTTMNTVIFPFKRNHSHTFSNLLILNPAYMKQIGSTPKHTQLIENTMYVILYPDYP